MKRILKQVLFTGILLHTLNGYTQTNTWKTEKTNDGKIVVKSNVTERVEINGKSAPLIEYVAITTDFMNLHNCVNIMKDVSRHKEFLDLKINQKVKTFSENKWLNYYVFNAPWPFPSTDCVVKVTYSEDLKAKTAIFTLTAAPNLMKATSMKRFTYYNFTYAFKDVGNGKVEATVTAKMALTASVPLWMLRSSFPDSAAEPLQKLVKIIKKNN